MNNPAAARARLPWRAWVKRCLLLPPAVVLLGLASFFILDRAYPFPRERLRDALATQSSMVHAADGSLLSWTVDADENWRLPVQLTAVSPHLINATIAVEDKRFYSHPGVDAIALTRAVWQNLTCMRRVSGASTITMQTVRLLWPRPRRLTSKLTEAFRAVQLERLVGKEGILELYFNLAPYGGNIVGAEAASRKYFGKSSANLSLGEASLLAGIPQSPARLDPRRHPSSAEDRRLQVLDRMYVDGMAKHDVILAAAEEETVIRTAKANSQLGHFSRLVQSHTIQIKGVVETTLIPDRQEQLEGFAREWSSDNPNIAGPAIVALRVSDGAIVAYVGNGGGKERPDWQVDAARMRRQAGSLLKPFLFACLAERGDITPSSMVLDTPGFWPDYAPENMDREWRGEMTAAAALSESRNLPAVRQLSRLGVDEFGRTLHALGLNAGVPSRQGLAMALGVQEQNLLSLVNAYAALARLGKWRPLRVLRRDDSSDETRRIWSAEAAWLTLSALSATRGSAMPSLAWKTGTSWNQQDAWAIALTPDWVVGVWCGRMRNGGGAWVAGGDNSLPLALAAIDALADNRESSWPAPEGIEFEQMCAVSGDTPGWHCPERLEAPYSRKHPPSRVCIRCGNTSGVSSAAQYATRPGTAPATGKVAGKARLQIAEPRPGSVFVIPEKNGDQDEPTRIYFKIVNTGHPGKLYWFLDGVLLSEADAGESVPWTATLGSHKIVAVDAQGVKASALFSVVPINGNRAPTDSCTLAGR